MSELSATDLCRATGLSYRILDYWCRIGVMHPAREASGSGTQRGFTTEQVKPVRVLVRLNGLGIPTAVLGRVWDGLEQDPSLLDGNLLLVDPDGDLTSYGGSSVVLDDIPGFFVGWLVSLHFND